jgi:transposase InsO family protein
MCVVFGVSKQAYYAQLKTNTKECLKEKVVVDLVVKERAIWKKGSGRNLHKCLEKEFEKHQLSIGRDKFFTILRNNGLLIKHRNNKARTTQSYHFFNKYKNFVPYNYICTRANEVWVSDITYIWLQKERHFCYLSMITDMYSRKIVGYCVHENLSVEGCVIALKMALKQRANKVEKLIHHSDRGVQYCCDAYVKLLQKNEVQISMTQTGDPKENAIAERVNKTIKGEFTTEQQINYKDVEIAKSEVKNIIDYYNKKRPHRSVEMLTPNVAHLQTGELKRKWKTIYKNNENIVNL